MTTITRRSLVLGTMAVPIAQSALSQPATTNSTRIVVPFPPGDTVDPIARMVQPRAAAAARTTIVIENKPGASGSIGTAQVAKSPPDGSNWVFVFDTHAVNPSLIPNLPFDTTRDLTPIMLVGTGGMALVAHTSEPYKSFRDVVAAAKAKPGSVAYGTIGAGSLGHLTMAQLGNQLGVEFNHVPYRGGGPLMNDAIGDQVPLAIGSVFLVSPYVTFGRLRAIAVTSAKPDPKLPGAEPIANQGVPGFEVYTWWGVFGPANMPAALVKRIYDEFAKAVKTPEVADKLSAQGIEVLGAPPDQLDAFVRKEMTRWAKVIKDNNIKSGD